MIRVENIKKTFNPHSSARNQVLKGVSFELPDKGLVAIFGKSGSGKTTLLNIIGGLEKADSGKIIVNGESMQGKLNFNAFTKRYPIVYSTTHALRSCTGDNFLYDCVIIDESSQVDLISAIIAFQGKEKDFIILSTVANKIKFYEDEEQIDFLNNPNLINVAISRAKKRLYILASEEVLGQEGSILRDLSKYYEYYCSETKKLKTNVFSVFDLMYDDYAPILEKTKKELLKISSFASENIIATVIDEICRNGEYGTLGYKFNYPLKYVIKTATLSDAEDIKFVSNINTHCDFLIYNKLNKEIEMVVEVDGSQHREEIQVARDKRKDRLLTAAGIKILRLTTTTIECKEKIVSALKKEDKDTSNSQENEL